MGIVWVVLNADGSYVGRPCPTWEEARELLDEDDSRYAYILDLVIDDVTDSPNGLL